MTTIRTLPPFPTRDTGAADFNDMVEEFLPELNPWGAEINAVAAEVAAAAASAAASALTAINAPGTMASSTTSLPVSAGSKSLGIQTGKSIQAGMWALIASVGSPTTWMAGPITAYNSETGALTVEVANFSGTGTAAAWNVSIIPPINFVEATAAQIRAGTSTAAVITPAALNAAYATVAIPFGTPLALNGADFFVGSTTATSNFTLSNPTGLLQNQTYELQILIGGGGGWTIGFGSAYEFRGDQLPTLSQTAGLTDILRFKAIGATGKVEASLGKGFSL